MLLAISPIGLALFVVAVVLLGAVLGGVLSRGTSSAFGNQMEKHDPRGERIQDPAGFKKPPREGGLL